MRLMRLNLVAIAYAFWLLATEVIFYQYFTPGENVTTLEMSAILGLIPAALQIMLLGVSPIGLVTPVRMALCFLLIALISYLGNAYSTSLTWLGSLVFVFGMAILVSGSPDERLIQRIAIFYSIPAAAFLLWITMTGEHVWGRLQAHGIAPDWWGLMGAGLAMAALAHRSRVLMVVCVAIGFWVTYDASARSNMMTIIAGLCVVGTLELRAVRGHRLLMGGVMSLAGLVVLMMFLPQISDVVTNAVVQTLQLNNPGRGLGSGFTGRTAIWQEILGIWLKHPFFGVGFHQHQMLTADHLEAHQVYLAMLADTGVFGLIWYVCFIAYSFFCALQINEPRLRNVVVGSIVAYATIGFADARGLSSGNPTSLYFEMCCFYAMRYASLRRVARSTPAAVPEQALS